MTSIQIDRTDGLSSSTAVKGPCRVAAAVNVVLNGLRVVDGVQTAAGDRVLLVGQTDARDNGIWVVDTGNWRRSADFNKTRDVVKGTRVWVVEGGSGPADYQLTTVGPVRVGVDALVFDISTASENAAAASQIVAEVSRRYLGSFPDDSSATAAAGTPSLGQYYWNSTLNQQRVWRGSVWGSAEGPTGDPGADGLQGPQGERDTRNFCWAGSFDWWRRGTTITATAARIGANDGWSVARSSGALGATVTQQQGSHGVNKAARVQRTAANTDVSPINFVFALGLDETRPLAGKQVTVGFRSRKGANYSSTSDILTLQIKTSNSLVEQAVVLTNGAFSTSDATSGGGNVTLTTTMQKFTFTLTVPSDAAQLSLRFTNTPVGTAGVDDWFEIEEVQVEIGSLSSTFVAVDPAYSLDRARRQYRKSYSDGVAPGAVSYLGALRATAVGTTIGKALQIAASFDAMRAIPTVATYSPQTGASGKMAQGSTADIDATVVHLGTTGFGIQNAAAAVNGDPYYVHYTAEARL